jgi:EpsD family peptidyl-prolyl cis-trans isomerase
MKSNHQAGTAAQGRASALTGLGLLSMALVLAGCGGGKGGVEAGDIAAKVNKAAIPVAQVTHVVQQQRGVRPEQADAAGKMALERLIDQELAVQKAEELKLEREPKVQQQIELARREVLARAYVEKIGDTAAKPTPEAVKQYYEDKPALFKERRVYNFQELAIEAKPEQIEGLRAQLRSAPNIAAFAEYLRANNVRFAANQAVRAAEQLPLAMVDAFSKLKDGQAVLMPSPTGAQVVVLAGSRMEPVDEAQARPVIEQFLHTDAKRKAVEADIKALRSAAKIEYVGRFAQAAASAPAASPPASLPVAASAAAASVPAK